MKPEQIMDALDHVGEDLLARSEQTIQSRRTRPWKGAAIAAGLALALGLGSFFGIRALSRKNDISPQNSGETQQVPEPGLTLPALAVTGSYEGGLSVRHMESRQALQEALADRQLQIEAMPDQVLPVYRNLAWREGSDKPHYLSREALTERLGALQQRLQLDELGPILYQTDGDEAHPAVAAAADQRDIQYVQLVVRGNGEALVTFSPGLTLDAASQDYEALARAAAERLGIPDLIGFRICRYREMNALASWNTSCYLVPLREDPVQGLLSDCFERIYFFVSEDGAINGIQLGAIPPAYADPSAAAAVPECYEKLSDYPVITVEEARALALDGNALLPGSTGLSVDLAEDGALELWELCYLTETQHELLLPYYRFWIPESSGAENEYAAIYVPAVRAEYLEDYPVPTTEPDPLPSDTTETPEPGALLSGQYCVQGFDGKRTYPDWTALNFDFENAAFDFGLPTTDSSWIRRGNLTVEGRRITAVCNRQKTAIEDGKLIELGAFTWVFEQNDDGTLRFLPELSDEFDVYGTKLSADSVLVRTGDLDKPIERWPDPPDQTQPADTQETVPD